MKLEDYINNINDFPIKGVVFRDISPLIANPVAFTYTINELAKYADDADVIAGLDARGFVFGAPLAIALKKSFIMVRKKSKLPGSVISVDSRSEYGNSIFEMQLGSIKPGQKVIIIDDLLATGGSTQAALDLIEKQKGVVLRGLYVIELPALKGSTKLKIPTKALVSF